MSARVLSVFAHYWKYHPRAHRVPEKAKREWTLIVERVREGYSVADICDAIDGCHRCPHNLGDNENGQKYLGLNLICRDGSHVTRFLELFRNGAAPIKSSRNGTGQVHDPEASKKDPNYGRF